MASRQVRLLPDPELVRLALERLLDRAGLALLACDRGLHVQFASPGALRVLTGGELPAVLARGIRELLADPLGSSRFTLETGVFHVDVERAPGPRVLVWLREEALHEAILARALRERYGLSVRGQQLLVLVREGLTNREIAERLGLSEATVKTYLHEVYQALGVRSRTGALAVVERAVDSAHFR